MPFFETLSDDQVAVFGCLSVLAISFGVMSISNLFSGKGRSQSRQSEVSRPRFSTAVAARRAHQAVPRRASETKAA